MHFAHYYDVDVLNGPGTRCTLFVSGCAHRCKGCYNAKTWHPCFGSIFTDLDLNRILTDLVDTRIIRDGLSLSGGDPLFPHNVSDILGLVKKVKQTVPNKTIWCWTGYRLEELNHDQQQVLPFIDVLVDGRYDQDLASPELPWRGSRNQRIIEQPAQALQQVLLTIDSEISPSH